MEQAMELVSAFAPMDPLDLKRPIREADIRRIGDSGSSGRR